MFTLSEEGNKATDQMIFPLGIVYRLIEFPLIDFFICNLGNPVFHFVFVKCLQSVTEKQLEISERIAERIILLGEHFTVVTGSLSPHTI